MKEIEKLIRNIGFILFGCFIASFFGAMFAPFVPGDPGFWASALLWLAVSYMLLVPGMLIMHLDVGRVEKMQSRKEESLFPEHEPFDPEDFEGENPFGEEEEMNAAA